jgi:RNA polymerase sigma-70 factor (ECF subfamily)
LLPSLANRERDAFEAVMRQHNGRLFRVARAILKDDAAAEDALQDAYLDAFRHLDHFDGRATLLTWLTRIVINRSLLSLRRRRRDGVVAPFDRSQGEHRPDDQVTELVDRSAEPPVNAAFRAEVRQLIEQRVDELPLAFRTVFVLCEVNEMSVAEVAESLSIPATTVRTRLFRARARLRASLAADLDAATSDVFGFAGDRCDRIVAAVLSRYDFPTMATSSRA